MDKELWKQKLKNAFSRKSLAGFIDKFGFYLALLVCIVVIGITALLTQGNLGEQGTGDNNIPVTPTEDPGEMAHEGDDEDTIDIIVNDVINDEKEPGKPVQTSSPSAGQEKEGNENTQPASGSESQSPGESQQNNQAGEAGKQGNEPKNSTKSEDAAAVSGKDSNRSSTMESPAIGEVIRQYAVDELVYSPTLKEWTTHTGIDIAGTLGGEVRAALAGTVESIEEDSLKGIVITLAHENGLKTVYVGLSTKDMVRVGQQVEKGQVISGIGRTAAFEIIDDPHVHFEVLLNGEHQDPVLYLQGK
ncbi:MAG TPA: peptidoglycan DD-metalloendopeptidase family protein [Clostridiales bacterium]|nr:peptidoglycan DD-metalloendopeptidase family protein [Clostridiales bacterium]